MITTPVVTSRAHQVPQVLRATQDREENRGRGGDPASPAHQACRDPQGNEVGVPGCNMSMKEGTSSIGAGGCKQVHGRLTLATYSNESCMDSPRGAVSVDLSSSLGSASQRAPHLRKQKDFVMGSQ